MKFGVVSKSTTVNRFVLHTLQRNITHLAVKTRKTNIKLGNLKGGNWKRANNFAVFWNNFAVFWNDWKMPWFWLFFLKASATPPPRTSNNFLVQWGNSSTRLVMKTKYIYLGHISLHVNFHNNPTMWTKNSLVKVCWWKRKGRSPDSYSRSVPIESHNWESLDPSRFPVRALFSPPPPPTCKFLHANLCITLSDCYENSHTE